MKTLFALLGPTGVGKTCLSLSLAEHLHSPVISADSRQIYRDIPIGTAAPTAEELARVHHYFIGTRNLDCAINLLELGLQPVSEADSVKGFIIGVHLDSAVL